MSSSAGASPYERNPPRSRVRANDLSRLLVPLARALFVAIFLTALPGHFSKDAVAAAAQHGVPLASVAVPLSGIVAFVGGLSVLFGVRARVGAWLLVLFLVPVTFTMHDFWHVADPAAARVQYVMFMKNLSMLGGALLVAYFGAGPVSFDARSR